MSDESRDFIWRVHDYTCSFIQFADTKAGVVFAWCSGLLAWLLSRYDAKLLFTKAHWMHDWRSALAMSLAVVVLAVSGLIAIWVISPIQAAELKGRPSKGNDGEDLTYWRSIRSRSADQYVSAVNAESFLEKTAALHVYTLAGIADRKYRKLFYAIWGSLVGTILSIVAFVLH